jgi:pantoate--beta-alanine ligase
MQEIDQVPEMQAWSDRTRGAGRRIGFVPTMGYLHEGHMSLVREARRRTDHCVASIFVNPLQFGPNEDLSRYPRDLDRDRARLSDAGVDVLYLPTPASMYPEGFQTHVDVNEATTGLCGRSRPGHFRGVTTVLTKLFNTVKPHVAFFGEKDFQQLVTVRRMVKDLDFDIEIAGMPIVREDDGVAMSSRNKYLTNEERKAARCLRHALEAVSCDVAGGERSVDRLRRRAEGIIRAEPLARIDYVELVDVENLRAVTRIDQPTLLALAVRFGGTRLIDNTVLEPVGE